MVLSAKKQKEKQIVHWCLAGLTVILLAMLVLFDDVGTDGGRAVRRVGAVIFGVLVQYMAHVYYQFCDSLEPEPEDGITGFNGSPERVFSSYNPIDNIDQFPM